MSRQGPIGRLPLRWNHLSERWAFPHHEAVNRIVLTAAQREELLAMVQWGGQAAAVVRRARVVLLTADDTSAVEIAARLDLSTEAVSRIRKRFLEGGVEALHTRPKAGRKDHALTSETVEYIVQLALSPPPRGQWRWTTRLLGSYFGITSGAVSDVLRKRGVKPHLSRTYEVSRDPQFTGRLRDVVGLYLKPPKHAIVLRLEEETSLQPVEGTQLPRSHRGGRAPRRAPGHEGPGVLEVCAALEAANGSGKPPRGRSHARADFLSFLKKVEEAHSGEALQVVVDNSSSHSTPQVREWLAAYPSVRVHYLPTRASWLKQVEGLFELLGRSLLSGTDFEARRALREPLRAYLRAWNQKRTPFEWTRPVGRLKARKRVLVRS